MRTSTRSVYSLLILASACTRTIERKDAPLQAPTATATPLPSAQAFADAGADSDVQAALPPSVASRMKSVPGGVVKQFSIGNGHVCAVMSDDSLECGSDPDAVFPLGTIPQGRFKSVHAGAWSTCAQKVDDSVVCFGSPRVTGPAPTGTIVRLCHDAHPCVERADGTAECFHDGRKDSLGQILPGSLACGSSWSCALTRNRKLRCVVVDKVMAFGSEAMPAANWTLPEGMFARVFSGYQHGCAMNESGSVVCWGRDTAGETRPPQGAFTTLALGEKVSCGLRPDGSIECWGGTPTRAPRHSFTAVAVTGHMDRRNTVCGLRVDKTLMCWPYGD